MKQEIIKEFDLVTGELLQILHSLSQTRLNIIPLDGGWTTGQIGEHLLKSYAVAETLNGSVKPTKRASDQKVEEVSNLFLNFNIKMDSPEAIVPTNEPIDKKDLLDALGKRIEQLREVILYKDLSMTCLDFAIPEYGEFTRLEWIWFNIVHTQRHVHQLKNTLKKINSETANPQ